MYSYKTTSTPIGGSGRQTYTVDDFILLNRFLFLGTLNGTYYEGQRKLTQDAIQMIDRCIAKDAARVLRTVAEISITGRAPENDEVIFVLARLAKKANLEVRRDALSQMHNIARYATDFFAFLNHIKEMGGSSTLVRRYCSKWYLDKSDYSVAMQMIKYRSRNGWTHSDALRYLHPKTDGTKNLIFKWARKGELPLTDFDNKGIQLIHAFEILQKETDWEKVVQIVRDFELPWEAIPTQFLRNKQVWRELVKTARLGALIRNLSRLASIELLEEFDVFDTVKSRLTNQQEIAENRIHPLDALVAGYTLVGGKSLKGKSTWTVTRNVRSIAQVLTDETFVLAFKNVTPLGKKLVIGIDCSGSMNAAVSNLPTMNCSDAASCMTSLFTTEPIMPTIIFFSDSALKAKVFTPNKTMTPKEMMNARMESRVGGGTALSVVWEVIKSKRLTPDAVIIMTDNVSWADSQALGTEAGFLEYKERVNPNVKAINAQFQYNDRSVYSPKHHLEVGGLDAGLYPIIKEYLNGSFQ